MEVKVSLTHAFSYLLPCQHYKKLAERNPGYEESNLDQTFRHWPVSYFSGWMELVRRGRDYDQWRSREENPKYAGNQGAIELLKNPPWD